MKETSSFTTDAALVDTLRTCWFINIQQYPKKKEEKREAYNVQYKVIFFFSTLEKDITVKHLGSYLFGTLVLIVDVIYIRWLLNGAFQQITLFTFIVQIGLLGTISGVTFWALTQHLTSMRKGKLRINFPNKTYKPGDILTGTLQLQTHTDLQAQSLRIALFTSKKRKVRNTMYHQEITLFQNDWLPPGEQKFEFAFKIPSQYENLPDHIVYQALAATMSGYERWYLEAKLDMEGADLIDYTRINVDSRYRLF